MQTTDPLSVTFGALADPTRRAILSRLSVGEATVNELSRPFDMSLQAVSRHLKVLERAGLITRRRDAQFRPCRFEAEPLDDAVDWIERHRRRSGRSGSTSSSSTWPACRCGLPGRTTPTPPPTEPNPPTDGNPSNKKEQPT